MSASMPANAAIVAGFALFGTVLAAAHFAALARQVRALAQGGGWLRTTLPLLRVVATAGGLCFAAQHGAGALIAAALGFIAARTAILHIETRRA